MLTSQGLEAFYEEYLSHSPEKLTAAKQLIGQLNLGQLEHDEYIRQVSALSEVPEQSARDFLETNKPNRKLLDYIRTNLKPKYKIGMLSNARSGWINSLLAPEDIALFDDIVLSADVKVAKPQSESYELAAQRLGVKPEECVFIDDIIHYRDAGEQAGMKAILYKNFEQMKAELEQILAADSNN